VLLVASSLAPIGDARLKSETAPDPKGAGLSIALVARSDCTELKALGLSNDDPFLAEMNDAFDITARRFRFVHALYRASESYADGKGDGGWLAKADLELDAAKLTVSARRKKLHDPDPKPILRDTPNPTFYKYGYLREADSLCFWVRERAQTRQLILQTGEFVPGCIF